MLCHCKCHDTCGVLQHVNQALTGSNSGEAQKLDVNSTISGFSSQEGMHHRQTKCLSCKKLGGHLENCDLGPLPVKLLFSDADQNESYPLAIVTNAQMEMPNI